MIGWEDDGRWFITGADGVGGRTGSGCWPGPQDHFVGSTVTRYWLAVLSQSTGWQCRHKVLAGSAVKSTSWQCRHKVQAGSGDPGAEACSKHVRAVAGGGYASVRGSV